MEALFIFLGIAKGLFIGWLVFRNRSRTQLAVMQERVVAAQAEVATYRTARSEAEQRILTLTAELAALATERTGLNEKLSAQKDEIAALHQRLTAEFKALAGEILDDKSKKFTEQNMVNLKGVLDPLRDRILEFEKKVKDAYDAEMREKHFLRKEVEQLMKLNQQVSEEANKLTHALKGDSKVQGDWGEFQLELILEKAGLERDVHFRKQENFVSDAGKSLRPDFVINLPDNKHLVVDSKVSLTAYESYFNAETDDDRQRFLKEHLVSVSRHVSDLSAKNYQGLYGINSPDYVLMFVPLEPALSIIIREDSRIFEKSLEKNVVMVTATTLLATLRTIAYIWKQENQKRNVLEIARESGALYDKFVSFVDDLLGVGKKIDDAKSGYADAMNKLVESPKRGDTIIGRIERIKALGANASKQIPQKLLDRAGSETADE